MIRNDKRKDKRKVERHFSFQKGWGPGQWFLPYQPLQSYKDKDSKYEMYREGTDSIYKNMSGLEFFIYLTLSRDY